MPYPWTSPQPQRNCKVLLIILFSPFSTSSTLLAGQSNNKMQLSYWGWKGWEFWVIFFPLVKQFLSKQVKMIKAIGIIWCKYKYIKRIFEFLFHHIPRAQIKKHQHRKQQYKVQKFHRWKDSKKQIKIEQSNILIPIVKYKKQFICKEFCK